MTDTTSHAKKCGKQRKRVTACVALVSALVALLSVSVFLKTLPFSSSPSFSARRVTIEASRGSQAVSVLVDVEREEQPGAWHSVNIGKGECKLLIPCRAGGKQRCTLLHGLVLPLEFDRDGAGQTRVYLHENHDSVHLWDIVKSKGAGLGLSCAMEAQLDIFKLGLGLGPSRTVNVDLELGEDDASIPRVRLERHSLKSSHNNLTVLTEGNYTLHVAYASTSGLPDPLSLVPISVDVDVESSEHRALHGALSVHGDLLVTRDEEAGETILSMPFEVKGSASAKKLIKAAAATGKLVPDFLKINHTKKSLGSTARRLASTTMTEDLVQMLPEDGFEESWVLDVPGLNMTVVESNMSMQNGVLIVSGRSDIAFFSSTVKVDEENDRMYIDGNLSLEGDTLLMLSVEADTSVGVEVVDTAIFELEPPDQESESEFLRIRGFLMFDDTMDGEGELRGQLMMEGEPEYMQVSMLESGESGVEGTDVVFEMVDGAEVVSEVKGMFRPDGESWNLNVTSMNTRDLRAEIAYVDQAEGFRLQSDISADIQGVLPLPDKATLSFNGNSEGWDLLLGMTEGVASNSVLDIDATFRDIDGNITFSTEVGGMLDFEASLDLKNVDAGFDFAFETTIGENETSMTIGTEANYRSEAGNTSLTLGLSGIADIVLSVRNAERGGGFDFATALLMDGSEELSFNLSLLQDNDNGSLTARFSGMDGGIGLDFNFTNDIPSDSVFRADAALLQGPQFERAGSLEFHVTTLEAAFTMSELQEGRTQLLLQQPFELFAGLKGPQGREAAALIFSIEQEASVVNADTQFMIAGSGGLEFSISCDSSTGTSMVLASNLQVGTFDGGDSLCIDFDEVFTRQSFTCGESMVGFSGTLEHGGTDFSTGVITMRVSMEDGETGEMVTETSDMFVNASRGFLMSSSIGGHDAMWFGMGMGVEGEWMNMTDFALVRPSRGNPYFQQGATAVRPVFSAPLEEEEAVVVMGALQLVVPDAAAFCSDQAALDSISSVIAEASNSDAGNAATTCVYDTSDGNVAGYRRLQETLDLEYTVVIKGDDTSGGAPPTTDEITAIAIATRTAIAEIDAESLETLVNEELASRGLNIAIIVESIEPPMIMVAASSTVDYAFKTTTTAMTTTRSTTLDEVDPPDLATDDDWDKERDSAVGPLVLGSGAALAAATAALAAAVQ